MPKERSLASNLAISAFALHLDSCVSTFAVHLSANLITSSFLPSFEMEHKTSNPPISLRVVNFTLCGKGTYLVPALVSGLSGGRVF